MNGDKARIFISYSHAGNGPKWKAALLDSLTVFEKHHLLDVWQDGKIRVSGYWEDDIEQAMGSARLAVILLTPEALESQFICEKEFPYLRERQGTREDRHASEDSFLAHALSWFGVRCDPRIGGL